MSFKSSSERMAESMQQTRRQWAAQRKAGTSPHDGEKPAAPETALAAAHAALLRDLQKLEESVRPSSSMSPKALADLLAATYADISKHFHMEEHGGYMAALRKREPRHDRTIQELAGEHRQLLTTLEGLVTRVRCAAVLDDSLRDEIRLWIHQIHQHEIRENDLVQDAYNLDIGAED